MPYAYTDYYQQPFPNGAPTNYYNASPTAAQQMKEQRLMNNYRNYYLAHPELKQVTGKPNAQTQEVDGRYFPSRSELKGELKDQRKAQAYNNVADELMDPDNYPGGLLTMIPALPIMGPVAAGFKVAEGVEKLDTNLETRNYPEPLKEAVRQYPQQLNALA